MSWVTGYGTSKKLYYDTNWLCQMYDKVERTKAPLLMQTIIFLFYWHFITCMRKFRERLCSKLRLKICLFCFIFPKHNDDSTVVQTISTYFVI